MTLIEIILMCVGKTINERTIIMRNMGINAQVVRAVHGTFTDEGELIGGLDDKYEIVKIAEGKQPGDAD